MPGNNAAGTVPGVNDSDLAATVTGLASLPVTEVDDAYRFTREVRAIVEKRAQDGWPNEGEADIAAFILTEYPRKVGKALGGKAVMDLLATKVPILGRVFLLTRDASNG